VTVAVASNVPFLYRLAIRLAHVGCTFTATLNSAAVIVFPTGISNKSHTICTHATAPEIIGQFPQPHHIASVVHALQSRMKYLDSHAAKSFQFTDIA
jgi:hypothetical protein